MAVTASLYNHTAKKFANGEVSLASLKLMLLNNSASFDASHTNISSLTSYQVSGNGWTSGGVALTNAAITTVGTNGAMLDADDIEVTASGGSIGPAYKAVIYDSDGSEPLVFIDFDGAKEAGDTTPFKVIWHVNGIVRWTVGS